MIIHEDGSFYLSKGETFPVTCPACGWPKPYDEDAPDDIKCDHCGRTSARSAWEDAVFKYMPPN